MFPDGCRELGRWADTMLEGAIWLIAPRSQNQESQASFVWPYMVFRSRPELPFGVLWPTLVYEFVKFMHHTSIGDND